MYMSLHGCHNKIYFLQYEQDAPSNVGFVKNISDRNHIYIIYNQNGLKNAHLSQL